MSNNCLMLRTKGVPLVRAQSAKFFQLVGDILVCSGEFFPRLTPARLAGATIGSSFLKMRGIYADFNMEIQSGDQRIVTTRVTTIAVEAPDARRTLPS